MATKPKCPVIAGRSTGWLPCDYVQDAMDIPDGEGGWRHVLVCARPGAAHMLAVR